LMAAAPAPNEGVTMRIPVPGRFVHCGTDLGPGLKAPSLQCQRSQPLPPRLNHMQRGCILRLEDELPARMRQGEQQDLGGSMGTPVIHHRVDPLEVGGNPRLHPRQAVHIVGGRPPRLRRRQRFAVGGREGPQNIPRAPAPGVDLLDGPPDWARRHTAGHRGRCRGSRAHRRRVGRELRRGQRRWRLDRPQPLSRKTLGALRPQLIQTHDDTLGGGRRVARRDDPLFTTKVGSTRSPNQVSCWCQRKPSASTSSSMRGRLIGSPLTS